MQPVTCWFHEGDRRFNFFFANQSKFRLKALDVSFDVVEILPFAQDDHKAVIPHKMIGITGPAANNCFAFIIHENPLKVHGAGLIFVLVFAAIQSSRSLAYLIHRCRKQYFIINGHGLFPLGAVLKNSSKA